MSESGAKDPQVLLSNSKQAGNFEGETAFNNLLKQQSIPFYVQYENPNRASTHRKIIYKRLTPINNLNMWDLFTNNWFDGGKGYQNNFNTDFKLFSNLDDAIADKNQWSFCNFNDQGIGFPRDCGPNGYVAGQWLSFKRASRGYGWENWSFSLMNQSGGGSQDTFTVVLGSEPTSNVVVDLTASDSTESVVSKSSLTFNASNWNQAQTVTVSGVDDPIRDELVNSEVVVAINKSGTDDTKYAALSSKSVSVSTSDDEANPLVSVATSANSMEESGGQVILTVKQDVVAVSDTTVTLSTSGTATLNADYSLSSTSLTIPAGSRKSQQPCRQSQITLMKQLRRLQCRLAPSPVAMVPRQEAIKLR